MPALAPDEIVLVFYANDFAGEPPFTPERIRPPFEPRYRPRWLPRIVQVSRRLIAGEPVALRWHGEAKPFLAAVPDPTNPWTDAREPSLRRKSTPDIADAMRRARSILTPSTSSPSTPYQFQRVVDVTTHLTFLRDFLAARGVRLRLAYLPYPAQVSDYYVAVQASLRRTKRDVDERTRIPGAGRAHRAGGRGAAACRFSISRRSFARAKRPASISTSTTITTSARRAMPSPPMRSTRGPAAPPAK